MSTLSRIVAATLTVTSTFAATAAWAQQAPTTVVPTASPGAAPGDPLSPAAPPAPAAAPALSSGLVCPAPDGASAVASVDAQRRLDYLARAFDDEVRFTDNWSWSLGTVFLVGGVTQAAFLPAYTKVDRPTSIDLTVGAITFGIGSISLFAIPLQLTLPLRDARKHWDDPDKCAVLARAERTLVDAEKEQARETGWVPHAANIAVNAAAAIILAVGYQHYEQAGVGAVIGTSLGELNAFSQPHNLKGVLAHYRAGELDAAPPTESKIGLSVVPLASPRVAGVTPMLTPNVSGAAVALTW